MFNECWELLNCNISDKRTSLQAVVFVRDLDRSVLGWGGHGLEHYLKLRAATDIVVNSILRVRRLLKQKRVANVGGMLVLPFLVTWAMRTYLLIGHQLMTQFMMGCHLPFFLCFSHFHLLSCAFDTA